MYGKKPTLEQRLAALPPPTYTPIVHKPILLDFDKLTTSNLIKFFTSKFDATLKCLEVFKTLQLSDKVNASHVNNLHHLIGRLQHLKRALSDIAKVRVRSELQDWDFGLRNIKGILFSGLWRNQVQIIKELSSVWNRNYFEYK